MEGGLSTELSTDSKLLILDSLLPVAKLLRGLTQEKNSGYVSRISLVIVQTIYIFQTVLRSRRNSAL